MTKRSEQRVLCIGCKRPHPYQYTPAGKPSTGWWCERCILWRDEYLKWYRNHEEEFEAFRSTFISAVTKVCEAQEQLHSEQIEAKRHELFGTWG